MDRTNRTLLRVAILFIMAAALGFSVYSSLAKDGQVVRAGQEAPNFYLEKVDGGAVKLSDLRGKPVVLNFWGSWCDPCKREMPVIEKAYQSGKAKGLVVIGVNIRETPLVVKQFAEQVGVTFPLLLDKDGQVTKLYNIGPIPTTFFIDRDGNVADIHIGEMNEGILAEEVAKIMP